MNFNINNVMKQAKKMQEDMMKMQEKLEQTDYEGKSGGGMVKVIMNGKGIAKSIDIDQSLINIDEKDMLEDLIIAAVNDAKKKIEEDTEGNLSSMMPPGFKLPF